MATMNEMWKNQVNLIFNEGQEIFSRDQYALEVEHSTMRVNMRYPVLGYAKRKLSYKYAAAEAYWILSGDNKVENLVPWNKNMLAFSDDGITYFGAYGPKIVSQLDYVVNKLVEDKWSRQAGLTIWRENPPKTKDVPCTVAIFFAIRDNKLNVNVFMRSSDLWLGVPYDVFTFSMLGYYTLAKLREANPEYSKITIGELRITAASSHLYGPHFTSAKDAIEEDPKWNDVPPPKEITEGSSQGILEYLKKLRDTKPGDPLRWWESSESAS